MITYNHEKFIAQAIDSVLMQQTTFDYELVIGEDCSTDGTRAIVVDYQQRYPDRIRAFLREKNLGMHENAKQTLDACRGEYIAFLEGDDYWTDPLKLQKQVDYLESHSEYSMCFHNVHVIQEGNEHEPTLWHTQPMKAVYTFEDLLPGNFIHTPSVMYRTGLVTELPAWYYEMPMGDWPLYLLLTQHGGAGYLSDVMAVYRKHAGGVWSTQKALSFDKAYLTSIILLECHLKPKDHRLLMEITNMRRHLVEKLWEAKRFREAAPYATHLLLTTTSNAAREFVRLANIILRGYLPWLWKCIRSIFRLLRAPLRQK